jgi:hypothetical protein
VTIILRTGVTDEHTRRVLRLRRRVASVVAALLATIAVVAIAAPGDAQAFAWKDICQIAVVNNTGSLTGLRPLGPILPEVPPNPVDETEWELLKLPGQGISASGSTFVTLGIPVTWGCSIHPSFKWGTSAISCNVYAPSSGRNIFSCTPPSPAVHVQITTDNDDIRGIVTVDPPPAGAADVERMSGLRASSAAVSPGPRRVPALLRRGDLPGRGWRAATKVTQFGRLGEIFATNNAPASCKDDKSSEPLAKRGGASAFARRSAIIGYEHGVYATARQSRRRLGAAVSTHSIRCLARLLTSARSHSHARFARHSLPGLKGVRLWRLVVRTRAGNRITRTNYLDVAGLLHRRSNALVLFANAKKPVSSTVEQSEIRTVASRLP